MLALLSALALAAVSRPGATPAAGGDVAPLVRRCVDAYGGKAALARAAAVRQEGEVTSVLHPGPPGRIVRAYERPGRLRIEIAYPGAGPEVRVLDGGEGWRDGEAVAGPRLEAMVLQAARMDLPALLSAPGAKLRDRGTAEHAGRSLRVVAIEPAPGLVVEAAIDPGTGRILRSRGTAAGAQPLEFVTSYSDFRKVEGVLVPFREENWANGRTTGETVLRGVTFPKALPEGTFRP